MENPNANTGYDYPDSVSALYYGAGQRLADKLNGAVNLAIDNLTAGLRIEDAKNRAMITQVQAGADLQMLVPLVIFGVIGFFLLGFLRR